MATSCSEESLINAPETKETNKSISPKRSQDEAITIALDASQMVSKGSSRVKGRKVSFISPITLKTSRADTDTTLFIVNFENEDGYVVVPTHKSLPPILAVTEKGNVCDIENIENPGLKSFIEEAMMLSAIQPESLNDREPIQMREHRPITIDHEVQPRVIVNWGQTGTIAQFCPNQVVGCSPLAAAMAMSYLERPTSLSLTFPNAPQSTVTLDWNLIKIGLDDYSLSLLCRELGHRMSSTYHPAVDSSSAHTSTSITNIYQGFLSILPSNISTCYTSYGVDDIYPYYDIRLSGVLIVTGYNGASYSQAHTFIIDGYDYYRYEDNWYLVTYPSGGNSLMPSYQLISSEVTEENLVHVNWGQNGWDNGYFYGNLIISSRAFSFDSPYLNHGYYPNNSEDNILSYNFEKSYYIVQ